MITRESVLTHAKLVGKICNSRLLTSDMLDALQGLIEYAEQAPDPDAAVWEEINELLEKLNAHDPVAGWRLVRGADPRVWIITTRERSSLGSWTVREMNSYDEPPAIRDQLHELATERGLFAPTLEDMQEIAAGIANGVAYCLTEEQTVMFQAYFAAPEKGGG